MAPSKRLFSKFARKPTFGQAVSTLRRDADMNQKQLAAKIRPDGKPISQQYLSDIENDRRSPSGEQLIKAMAKALGTDESLLFFYANQLPSEIRNLVLDDDQLAEALKAFKAKAEEKKRRA
jgi:transcriptional regulator with XRE-family HTH domain